MGFKKMRVVGCLVSASISVLKGKEVIHMERKVYRTPRISPAKSWLSKVQMMLAAKSGMDMCKHTYAERLIRKAVK